MKNLQPSESSFKAKPSQMIPRLTGLWIRVHIEMLEDPIIATLSALHWRRCLELKMLIGPKPKSGNLPNVKIIAFRLRVPESQITAELDELATLGIIEKKDGGFSFPNLVEEQAADSIQERVSRHRKSKLKRYCNEEVTKRYLDVDRDRDVDKEIDAEEKAGTAAAAICENAETEPDEAFWERMKALRPDLSIPKMIEAMQRHLHKTNDTRGITRRFAEKWIRRESAPVRLPRKASAKSNPSPQIDEQAALAWLQEEYAGTQIEDTPVSEYREPFNRWNKFAQEAYLKTL